MKKPFEIVLFFLLVIFFNTVSYGQELLNTTPVEDVKPLTGKEYLEYRDSLVKRKVSHPFMHLQGYIIGESGLTKARGEEFNQPEFGFSNDKIDYRVYSGFGLGVISPINKNFFFGMELLYTFRGYKIEREVRRGNDIGGENVNFSRLNNRSNYLLYQFFLGTGIGKTVGLSTGFGLGLITNSAFLIDDTKVSISDSTGKIVNEFVIKGDDLKPEASALDVLEFMWNAELQVSRPKWPVSTFAGFTVDVFGVNTAAENFLSSNTTHVFRFGLRLHTNYRRASEKYWDAIE